MKKPRRDNSDVFNDIAYGVQHDAFDDLVDQHLLRAWSLGVANEKMTLMLQGKVRKLKNKEAFGELIPFRRSRLHKGEIVLGQDASGSLVRIPLRWLLAGLLIVGNTGCGKSTLISSLLTQIAASGCKVWASDLYKKQLRQLRRPLQRLGINLVILRPNEWKYNVLQASCNPRIHLPIAADLLVRELGLPPRGRSIIRQAIHALYTTFNIWNGQGAEWPCLFDLYEWVLSTPKLNQAAREAILDRLGSLLLSLTPQCGAYRRAWTAPDIANHSIVFEMRGISEQDKSIRLGSLLFSLFQEEAERGSVNVPLSLWLCFEDAQRFFNASHSSSGEVTPMEELASVIRGMGKGMCFAAQTMNGLSRSLIPNMATRIMGRLGMHEDYQQLSSDLGMNANQREWAKRHLNVGQFICQVSEGSWREPCIFTAPNLTIQSTVDDAEAAESVKALDYIKITPATEFANWQPHYVIDLTTSQGATATGMTLSDVEQRFLEAVVSTPGKPVSFYCKLTRISGKRAADIRTKLVGLGYAREHKVQTGQRRRSAILLEPLDRAIAAVSQSNK